MSETNKSVELIQKLSEFPPIDADTGEPYEAILTKFVIIMEWMGSNNQKWLTKTGTSGAGDPIPEWDKNGMLHEGLYGDW